MSGIPRPIKELNNVTLTAAFSGTSVEFPVGTFDQVINYVRWTPGDATATLDIETAFKNDSSFFLEAVEDEVSSTGIVTLRAKTRKIPAGGATDPILLAFAIPLGDKDYRIRFKEDGTPKGTLDYYQTQNWLGPA